MNKFITKRIRRIESQLTETNADITRGLAEERTVEDSWRIRENLDRREALEVSLDFHMAQSPEEISRDVMPAEAATEMLCDPKAHLSARMRKNCMSARETHYQSVRERSPGAVKLARRLRTAKLTQLGRWLRRAASRIGANAKQLRTLAGLDNPQANAIRSVLNSRGVSLEIARAALRAEISIRNIA